MKRFTEFPIVLLHSLMTIFLYLFFIINFIERTIWWWSSQSALWAETTNCPHDKTLRLSCVPVQYTTTVFMYIFFSFQDYLISIYTRSTYNNKSTICVLKRSKWYPTLFDFGDALSKCLWRQKRSHAFRNKWINTTERSRISGCVCVCVWERGATHST